MSPRSRNIWYALAGLALAWLVAFGGFALVRHSKATPAKVRTLLQSTDLSRLTPEERRKILRRLADLLNRLNADDRRTARMAPEWRGWIREMTEAEKGELLEATLPSGITQMLSAFEEMPADRRQRLIEDSLRRLRESRLAASSDSADGTDPGGQPADPAAAEDGFDSLPPEVRDRLVSRGLRTFMQEGSADTKAQLQPLVEELQRSMETGAGMGRAFRRPREPRPQP